MKFNDTTWVNVGTAGFAHSGFTPVIDYPCVAFDKFGYYFGFHDVTMQRLHVMEFFNNSWQFLGSGSILPRVIMNG